MHITSISSWALIIWKTLEKEGFDPSIAFKRAGADIHKLSNPEARYPLETMHKLWGALAEQTQDTTIGVRIGQQWDVTTFHALGYAWLASSSLLEAFERFNRYAAIINNALVTSSGRDGSLISLQLESHADPALIHDLAVDAGISAIIKMCKMLVGEHFLPVKLDIKRSSPAPMGISQLIAAPIEYNATHTALWVDIRTAEQTLLSGNDKLAFSNEQLAHNYLDQVLQGDIELSAFNLIVKKLPSGETSEDWIAEQLHMSVRTLRRKLNASGTSFRELLNSVRKEIALHHVNDTNISCIEIAYLLGFSDQANFTRAFKRWYNCTPTEYREQRALKRQAVTVI
ncbi:AraC family transcriptional regulator [Marinagarivorans cellulosilyticus]|uniref:HTH araC/xylS-type domain-containing protein n=1 Tax=Marinagarivorans cellulosilyticus TaxID=2721545 RepID=A0AAN1WHT4_9GAMM|nr:AraC family transcriptional regulator [Marinagarivorans cellulosilyticus]BCD97868.1 hypothetical protein MARGE09_P2069 [Marinagarivorans cellulosilyticus]